MLKYFIYLLVYSIIVKAQDKYGEFDLAVTEYIHCKGPKRKTCVNGTETLVDNRTIRYNFLYEENMRATKGRITGTLNGRELIKLNWKDCCENIFMRALLKTYFKIGDSCNILKGTYRFTLDLQSVTRKFYGGKFVYGNWTIKSLFYTEECNLHCALISLDVTPMSKND